MSNNNDMKTEVIIPGNEKNEKNFIIELMRDEKEGRSKQCQTNKQG